MKWVWDWWVKPLIEECPKHIEERDHIEAAFGVHHRYLCTYKARRPFSITGTYKEGGVHLIEGWLANREVPKSAFVVVRRDIREPFYDVEHEGHVFRLTLEQWRELHRYLRPAKGEKDLKPEGKR
jgi:hypothetical protein